MTIVEYGPDGLPTNMRGTHGPASCAGRLCDVHGRFGSEPWASWARNWREDRGMMEMIDPATSIGHPSPAQVAHWESLVGSGVMDWPWVQAEMVHGCDGGCAGAYD